MSSSTAVHAPSWQVAAKPSFRRDIEGLRGLAIVLVILGHIGLNFHGGVDLSFVISGFLVTFLLLREHTKTGLIRFARFYASRARRLGPAATLVTVATLLAAFAWMSPLRLRGIGMDGLFSAISAINWRLAAQATDYFSNKSASPFQHFWSLAIEEQFYFVWPLLLLIAVLIGNKLGKPRLFIGILLVIIVVTSLYFSITITHSSQPWAYFGFHTRAWELGVGALVAVAINRLARLPQLLAAIMTWVGLAIICISAVLITNSTPLPGYAVGWPILGGALVIAGGCAAPILGAERLLAFGALRYVGRISYSLYLWHWPIVVILPEVTGRELNTLDRLTVVALTFVLSILTFHCLESPIRNRKAFVDEPTKGLTLGFQLIILAIVSCLLTAFFLAPASNGAPGQIENGQPASEAEQLVAEAAALKQLPPEVIAALPNIKNDGQVTCIEGPNTIKPDPCTFGDAESSKEIALVGDSHALQWTPALDLIGKNRGLRVTSYAKAACTPEPYVNTDYILQRRYTECEQWRELVFADIETRHPGVVIVSAGIFDGASGEATATLARRIIGMGIKFALIDDTPGPFKAMPECLSKATNNAMSCATPRAQAMYKADIRQARHEATVAASGTFVEVVQWFCTNNLCPGVVGKIIVFIDGSHISATYARWLTSELEKALAPVL